MHNFTYRVHCENARHARPRITVPQFYEEAHSERLAKIYFFVKSHAPIRKKKRQNGRRRGDRNRILLNPTEKLLLVSEIGQDSAQLTDKSYSIVF